MAFDYDSLFNKSRVLIDKSIVSRNAAVLEDCQLWAALAQELLAKAALAHIHPALVADPTCADSLFAACGKAIGAKRKSIQAKTVYARMRQLSPQFDQQALDFCMLMAARRNAHLHSGEVPYVGMALDAWAPKYWSVAKVLLQLQGKSLNDWVGDNEAVRLEEVIAARTTALEHSVEARVAARRAEFLQKYPEGSKQREALDAQRKALASAMPKFPDYAADLIQSEDCPSCGFPGGLACERMHDEPVEVEADEGWEYYLNVSYEAQGFRCDVCGLLLRGREELEAADLNPDIEIEEPWEPDHDEDYGND